MTDTPLTHDNIVDFPDGIFTRRGNEEYLGEPVTMAQHMLQGAMLAEQAQEDEVVVAAALLHDIGHFTSECGSFSMQDTEDKWHEVAGAELLEPFFPPLVIDCIRYHVAAKRYLCTVDPDYFSQLSEASVHSLKLQGGKMSDVEAEKFVANNNVDTIVRVRLYDDAGKDPNLATRDFREYKPLLQRVVDRTRAERR
jgi:predicted HD phosphohydrolase